MCPANGYIDFLIPFEILLSPNGKLFVSIVMRFWDVLTALHLCFNQINLIFSRKFRVSVYEQPT